LFIGGANSDYIKPAFAETIHRMFPKANTQFIQVNPASIQNVLTISANSIVFALKLRMLVIGCMLSNQQRF
jgi:hypothetical protein